MHLTNFNSANQFEKKSKHSLMQNALIMNPCQYDFDQ